MDTHLVFWLAGGLSQKRVETAERHGLTAGLNDVDAAFVRPLFVERVGIHEWFDDHAEEILRSFAEAAAGPGIVQFEVHTIRESLHVIFVPGDSTERQRLALPAPRDET